MTVNINRRGKWLLFTREDGSAGQCWFRAEHIVCVSDGCFTVVESDTFYKTRASATEIMDAVDAALAGEP